MKPALEALVLTQHSATPKGTLLGAKLHSFLLFSTSFYRSSLFSTRVKHAIKDAGVLKTAQTVNGNAYSPDQGSSGHNHLFVTVLLFRLFHYVRSPAMHKTHCEKELTNIHSIVYVPWGSRTTFTTMPALGF